MGNTFKEGRVGLVSHKLRQPTMRLVSVSKNSENIVTLQLN